MRFPGLNFDLAAVPLPQPDGHIGYPTPESGHEIIPLDGDFSLDNDLSAGFQLPSTMVLNQLVELFFEHLRHMFPCFHRRSFTEKVQNGSMIHEAPLLLYAICCTAARYHSDEVVRKCEKDWYEQARFSYELTRRRPCPGLRTIQAALLLIFHAYTVGDFSASWLFVGKAWRQAVVLGMNRMDATHAVAMNLSHPNATASQEVYYGLQNSEAKTAVESEEYRRVLWLLFIMDRNHAWPTGWPHAIVETQFKVDIPLADSIFQAMDPEWGESIYTNVAFTTNISRSIASLSSAKDPINLFHYIAVAHVLLGKVAGLIHSL